MRTLILAAAFFGACMTSANAQTNLKDLKLDIPATTFTLKNGLTLIVHEDRKAPVVAVQMWYGVGSRDEPAGRSGFAHLFEHLMFNGSEHSDTDWFKPARAMGATSINGTTNGDRTNYFQTVPKGALDSILWLESDRMGHFLGAVTQAKLDEQRGVVQNEKRQGENRPYGLAYERITTATYPAGHPYAHTTIGSMDDLNAAKLEDVKEWFRKYYGPSNAIIALVGDISPQEALAKVERAFGDIPAGPPVVRTKEWTAKRSGTQREVGYDQVAQPRIYKVWNVPPHGDRDTALLVLAGDALTGGRTSRLYKRLVHDEQIATNVSAGPDTGEIASQFYITVDAKPDADLKHIEAVVAEELARVMKDGPTVEELNRARTDMAASWARTLEGVHTKANVLIQAQAFHGDPAGWRKHLDVALTATPADVQGAARRWLSDGEYSLTILPRPALSVAASGLDRSALPKPGLTVPDTLPAFERASLANGLKLIVVSRRGAPLINMSLVVETGYSDAEAALPAGTPGIALRLLDQGTVSRTGLQIDDELRGLGANLSVSSGDDEQAGVSISTLTATLDPALALFADVALHPAFREEDVDRLRQQAIVGVERGRWEPGTAAARALRTLTYGADHPYGRLTTEASLAAFTREQLAAYHRRWFTPDNGTLIIVGDTTLNDIKPKIEKAFGGWSGKSPARKAVPDAPAAKPGIYMIDRPGAPQSYILGASVGPRWTADDEIALALLNDGFGGTFTSRLNMNLREDKHWSYGVRSTLTYAGRGPRLYQMAAPVQTDKTAESFLELKREMTELAGPKPLTAAELETVKNDTTLALPGRWETLGSVSGAISALIYRGLPDDYYARYPGRVMEMSTAEINRVTAKVAKPGELVWVVVGDREKIGPALAAKGIGPVVMVDADGRVVK